MAMSRPAEDFIQLSAGTAKKESFFPGKALEIFTCIAYSKGVEDKGGYSTWLNLFVLYADTYTKAMLLRKSARSAVSALTSSSK